jgi:hypothetical protein
MRGTPLAGWVVTRSGDGRPAMYIEDALNWSLAPPPRRLFFCMVRRPSPEDDADLFERVLNRFNADTFQTFHGDAGGERGLKRKAPQGAGQLTETCPRRLEEQRASKLSQTGGRRDTCQKCRYHARA